VGQVRPRSQAAFTFALRVAPVTIPPLPLRPELRRRPWGGERLVALWPGAAADREPGEGPFGEAWLAGPGSRVASGPWAEATLRDLASDRGAELIGTFPHGRYGARFPLLAKVLDAAEPLSLQVHPDDAYALRHEAASGHLGKTEAWWVLEAEPGATLWWGFARPTERAEIEIAVAAGTLAGLLRRLPAAAGDVVVNPAGTVHGLGAGVTVFEIQQASDLTYRLDDHGRVGPDGRPRELHLVRGLEVADLAPGVRPAPPPQDRGDGRVEMARTHAFVLERVTPAVWSALGGGPVGAGWDVGVGSCELLTHLPGTPAVPGRLTWSEGEVALDAHTTWLLPAGLGPVRLVGGGPYARSWVPDPAIAP
jgi:mannose-6-phosphate isomerase